jgi:hypothetical protein
VQNTVLETEAGARAVLDCSPGEASEASLHGGDRVERRQHLLDLELAEVEGQGDV